MTARRSAEAAIVTVPAQIGRFARFESLGREFVLYFGCSALALATDIGVYAAGLQVGLAYEFAAALGFAAGLMVAYTLSVRVVFRERRLRDDRAEFFVFAAVGICGLLLTEMLLWMMVGQAHWHPLVAKIGAAGFVFCFNFGVRKVVLFTRQTKP